MTSTIPLCRRFCRQQKYKSSNSANRSTLPSGYPWYFTFVPLVYFHCKYPRLRHVAPLPCPGFKHLMFVCRSHTIHHLWHKCSLSILVSAYVVWFWSTIHANLIEPCPPRAPFWRGILQVPSYDLPPLIARFMGPICGPSGTDRTQVGPMLAPWTLLSGTVMLLFISQKSSEWLSSCILSWQQVCSYTLVRLRFYMLGPFILTWFEPTLIPAWISNHLPSKVRDKITYLFPNSSGFTVKISK